MYISPVNSVVYSNRKKLLNICMIVLLLCAVSVFSSCRTTPGEIPRGEDAQNLSAEAAEKMDELLKQVDRGEFFEENLPAKIKSIGILRPEYSFLSADEQWIPDMIKSAMNNNFRRFASGRITVMNIADEETLNHEITKSLMGSNDELSLTARLAARSLMTGKVIKQSPTRFILEFTVTDTETHVIIASYSQNHSDIELTGGIAINKATESLLKDLNIRLNDAGRYALYGASNEADTALAKGINAAESGQGLKAMNYLYNAASFNATATQASASLAEVQNQNQRELHGAGSIVMDFFERQELWQNRLDEFNAFYDSHAPFELFYTPPTPINMRVTGDDRTYDLHFKIGLRWNENQISVMEKVLQEYIYTGLLKNPSQDIQRWELKGLPGDSNLFKGPDNFLYNLLINVENERGEVIASNPVTLNASLYRYSGKIFADCIQELDVSFRDIRYIRNQITPQLYIRIVSINGTNIRTIGENGFMRVVQTQDRELPAIQPNSLPRALVNSIEKDIAAEKERERISAAEREKQRLAWEKERKNAAKERELSVIRNSIRYGVGAYGGPVLNTNAGTVVTHFSVGKGSFNMEWGILFYPGASKDYFKSYTDSDVSFLGINCGLYYTFVGLRWFLYMGPGINLFLPPDSGNTYSSENNIDTQIIPNFYTMLDVKIYGPIYIKLGYRFDLYPDKLAPMFDDKLNNIGKFIYAHNALFGVGLLF